MTVGSSLINLLIRWRQHYPLVRETLDALGIAGLLAGGIFAAIQYKDAKGAQRIARTFEYIERYESGDVAEARRAINRVLRQYLTQFEELEAAGLPCDPRDNLVRSIIKADVELQMTGREANKLPASGVDAPETIEDKIDRVVEFFDGLKICVHEEICNRRVAENYFSPDEARIFWNNFYPYISDRRKNYANYGKALEEFTGERARMCGGGVKG